MRPIVPYWLKYRKTIILALIFLSIEAFCDLLQPTIVARVIDDGVKNESMGSVMEWGALMLLVAVIGAANAVGRSFLASRISQRFGADIRLDLFKKINQFSFTTLGKHETASLITRVTNDTTQLTNFTNGMMRIFVKSPILLTGAFIMVTMLNVRLALVLAAVVPIVALLIYASMKIGYPYFTRMQKALDANNAVIREYLSGVRVVKAFNTFDQETARFGRTNESLTSISITAHRAMSIFSPIISFTVNAGIVAALWLARGWVADSQLMVGQIIAFINYMTQILFSLGMIFMVYQQLIRARASAERVAEILQEDESGLEAITATDSIEDPAIENIRGDIEFKNVTFSYSGIESDKADKTPVLSNISFTLPSGGAMAIIGSTGSGKSSLISLIAGFYPFKGEIFLDNKPLTEYRTDFLRGIVSLAAQQSILFHGTISENIRMGKKDASMEDITEAAKAAQAHDFIAGFPDGYETVIGQLGVNLSGGQKQRISIARALVRKSPVLILDDCVSAVDSETEAAIHKSINGLQPKPTLIMITQRISSVMNFPYILVLDEGAAAGFGDHNTLLANCPVYREIYDIQNMA